MRINVMRAAARPIVLVALGATLLGGCAGAGASSASSAEPSGQAATTVDAVLSDFKIELGSATAPAGPIDFKLSSSGPSEHEFVIFKTDLPPDQLPLIADGSAVDEAGAGVTAVDEVEDIAADSTHDLPVTLEPGKYVFVCNLPAHYGLGMRVGFEVSGS